MSTKLQHLVLVVSLVGVLLTALSACTTHRDRFPNNFGPTHQQFYEEPYTQAEDRRFHEGLAEWHRDHHDRDGYGRRYDDRDSDYRSLFRW
jgi:hypothetical protein